MKNRRKNRKVLLLTLIAVLLMGVLSVGDNPPVQSAWNAVTGGIFSLSARIAAELKTPSTDELLDENERLRSENAALQKALAENLELKDENKTLWGYFGMISRRLRRLHPRGRLRPRSQGQQRGHMRERTCRSGHGCRQLVMPRRDAFLARLKGRGD